MFGTLACWLWGVTYPLPSKDRLATHLISIPFKFKTHNVKNRSQIVFSVDDMFGEQSLEWRHHGFGEYHHHQHCHHRHTSSLENGPLFKDPLQVIGYNSVLVSQLQTEKNQDIVFTFELASWICQSSLYLPYIIKDWKFEYFKIMWTMTQLIIPHPPASLWAIASVAGCLLGSVLSDFLGRRKALMVHSFFTLHTVVDLSYYRLLVRVWIIILSIPT